MRVLVTGGAGYIGSHTVSALKKSGHHPIIVDNFHTSNKSIILDFLKVPFVESCISNKKVIREILQGKHQNLKGTVHENKSVECIMHFAADSIVDESIKNPISYYKNNLVNSITLLELIMDKSFLKQINQVSIPFIFSSTCSTYGINNNIPITEEFSQNPINPYAKSKYFFEEIIKDISNLRDFKCVVLRYFNVAGASKDLNIGENRETETHLIPLAVKTALGLKETLSIFGDDYDTPDGTCIRDYIHVCDVADAHVKVLDIMCKNFDLNDKNFEAFNIGIGNGYSVREVIDVTEEISNKKIKTTIRGRREGDPPILVASSEKFKKKFDWEPKHKKLESIVKDSFNWQKSLYENLGLI